VNLGPALLHYSRNSLTHKAAMAPDRDDSYYFGIKLALQLYSPLTPETFLTSDFSDKCIDKHFEAFY